ncbi:MAG: Gfo/Idh/MocA family oxidoreductase [Verrucomicrobiota bacterium]|nr:Gfo/Idh/MocA family oxidoreductase [Verrucomicrobiota bacterium]
MNDSIGFAIIGSGMISQFHADAMRQVPGAELRAVYDRVPERARQFSEKNGCRVASTLEELVKDAEIQAACVTTPSGSHAEAAVPFLEAGKAVLCEKPLEVTNEAVERILDAARRGGGVLAGVFQNRLGRGAQAIKAAVEAGRFGRLTLCSAYIKWWRDQSYYDSSVWKGTWKLDGGGALMNQGIHAVDLLQWLVGLPEEVTAFYATLAHERMEAEDTLVAALKFPNGALGVIEAATSCWPGSDLRIEIAGDKGFAELRQDRLIRWDFAEARPEDDEIRGGDDAGAIGGGAADPSAISTEGHRRLIADLVEALRDGRAPMIPGADARRGVALATAIYEAARSGGPVKVS